MLFNRVIYRESVLIQDEVRIITGDRHFKVIHVAPSRAEPEAEIDIWFETHADDDHELVRRLRIYGTGHVIPMDHTVETVHVGTAVTPSGMVWHVYEERAL